MRGKCSGLGVREVGSLLVAMKRGTEGTVPSVPLGDCHLEGPPMCANCHSQRLCIEQVVLTQIPM